MNDPILIEIGTVSEKTLGTLGCYAELGNNKREPEPTEDPCP